MILTVQFPKYFTTTSEWSSFWQKTQNDLERHFVFQEETIYEYTTISGIKYWYIPHLGYKKHLNTNFINSLKTIAKQSKISYITFEVEDSSTGFEQILNQTQTPLNKKQYNQTIVINLKDAVQCQNPTEFISSNNSIISSFNQTVRRKIRKSIKYNWLYETQKSKKTFEDFWYIYNKTADRQNFRTHQKKYYFDLFKESNSIIIVIYDNNLTPQGTWFGWKSQDTLTYLYGGNSQVSLQNYGTYYLQLQAMCLASQLNLTWYDLGGYTPNSGYGRFKEGFRGILRTFPGPYDIVINNKTYFLLKVIKRIRKLFIS